jgi:hypothetical protein
VFGTQIEVPTIDGRAKIKIPPGTQSGKIFRLKRRYWGGAPLCIIIYHLALLKYYPIVSIIIIRRIGELEWKLNKKAHRNHGLF